MSMDRFQSWSGALGAVTVLLVALLGCLVTRQASAQNRASDYQSPASASPALDTTSASESAGDVDDEPPFLGLMVDAGVPDGAMASVAYRPFGWLRVQGGAGTNSISPGVRIGASLVPFGIGPSLTLEGGHYFEGNANKLARSLSGADYEDMMLLDRIGYDFANAHLGLELGGESVVFYVHGGVSYVRTKVHNVGDLFTESMSGTDTTATVSINRDPTVVGMVPSMKLGLAVFFL